MISLEHEKMLQLDMLTPNGLASACGTSRRTIQRMYERNLLQPSITDEQGRRYYSINDAMCLRFILMYEKLGMNTDQIHRLVHFNPDENVIDELFGGLRYFLKLLEADEFPFTLFYSGNIITLKRRKSIFRIQERYEKEYDNMSGWEPMQKAIHEALTDSICGNQGLFPAYAIVEVTFDEDGTPITHKITIPLEDTTKEMDPSYTSISLSLYAAWYGGVEQSGMQAILDKYSKLKDANFTRNPAMQKGPAAAFDQMQQKAIQMGLKPSETYNLLFVRDFYSFQDYNMNFDTYMYLELPILT